MCEFCSKHGEGEKWYLNAKNYSQALLSERHNDVHHHLGSSHKNFVQGHRLIDNIAKLPFIGRLILDSGFFKNGMQKGVFGQAVPIEDITRILGFVKTICLFPCICRQMSYNRNEELYCFGVSLGTFAEEYLCRYPDVTQNLEKVSSVKALEMMRKFETEGNFHSVWTVSTPFIATICNCNGRDCLSVKQRQSYQISTFFKSEYIARIDPKTCSGCRKCLSQCNFGAIHYSSTLGTCRIHPKLCFGCGICRPVCPGGAISLSERKSIPGLRNDY